MTNLKSLLITLTITLTMNTIKFITFSVLILLSNLKLNASHLPGGDLVYECIGQDSFLVTLTLFRDCSGTYAPSTTQLNLTSDCGPSITATLVKQPIVHEVSQICASMLGSSSCNGGSLFGLEAHIYSGIVVLSPQCSNWTFSYSTCCRNLNINNLSNPGGLAIWLGATLNSSSFPCNNSPYFTEFGMPSIYLAHTSQFNLGAIDPDGDSLVYFMSPGFETSTSIVPYAIGYTPSQPLGGSGVTLNSSTGQLSLTPSVLGIFVINVRVEEYDRNTGFLKGTIRRDFQVNVISSSQSAPQFSASGMTNLADGTLTSGILYACFRDSLDFNISLSDVNISDSIAITHNIYAALDTTAVVILTGSNPVIVNVKWIANSLGQRSLRIRGTDGKCPIPGVVSENFQIVVAPSIYAGLDVNLCVGDTANLIGIGGTNYSWVSISGSTIDTNPNSPTYNMTCNNCSIPAVFPNVTTTYLLTANAVGVCGNTDTVTVNVSNSFSINLSNDTIICNGDSLQLSVSVTPSSNNYLYQWSNSMSLNNDTVSNPYCSPSVLTSYSVSVNYGMGCVKQGIINVDVTDAIPGIFSLLGDSIICQGDSVHLEVILPDYVSNVCAITNIQSSSTANYGVIGTMATTPSGSGYPSVYGRFYWGNKHQLLYTAAELSSMGMVSGSIISSLGFDVATVGAPNNMDNMTIRIGCTNVNSFTPTFLTGLSVVVNNHTYFTSLGWNMHQFDHNYVWDGVSNLIVEICTNNTNYSTAATSITKYSPTTYTSVLYTRGDNGNVCSSTNNISSFNRPNTKFEHFNTMDSASYNYSWSPVPSHLSPLGIHAVDSPMSNTTYNVLISDSVGLCTQTITQNVYVTTSAFDAGFVFDSVVCINGPVQTLLPLTSGGVFTGSGVSSMGVFDPANAGVGTWNINYFIPTPAQCSNDSTMSVTVLPLPDATVTLVELCLGASNIFLSAATSGGVWSGAGIVDTLTGEFSSSGLQLGNSSVTYTLHNPCENSETATIRIIEPFQFTIPSNSIKICEGSTANLLSHISLSGSPFQGSHPVITFFDVDGYVGNSGDFDAQGVTPGIYSVDVSVADSSGNCGTTQSFSVEVTGIDYASIISDLAFCISQSNVKIFVQPWLYGAGVTFSQTPLGPLGTNDTLHISSFGQNGQFTPSVVGLGSWELTINYINAQGCIGTIIDTIYVLDAPTAGVTNNGVELTATAGIGYTYQWLDCDNNMNPITGANSATFIPGKKGNYAVEVSAGNCIEISDCYETWTVGISNGMQTEGVSVFPNPMEDKLTIVTPGREVVRIQVLDNTGKMVKTQTSSETQIIISVKDLASGVYLIKIEGDTTHFSQKLIKK